MKRALLILISLLFLCSCAYTEPNAVYTVTAVGLEENGDKSRVTVKITESEKSRCVTGEGETPDEAMSEIKTRLSARASFEHCQLIAISGLGGEGFAEATRFLREQEVPLRTKIVYTDDIQKAFEKERESEIASLLKETKSEFGFGGNTALFEIETAILINNGDFALPYISLDKEDIKISGLLRYKNSLPYERLNVKQSVKYAKEILN